MTDSRVPGRNRPHSEPSGSFGGISSGASARSTRRSIVAGDFAPTADAVRAGRRRWATGVAVATTLEGGGGDEAPRYRGATMSSIQMLSLDPPLIGLSLEAGGRIEQAVVAAGVFSVSILDRAHEFLSDRFSGYGPQPDAHFGGIPHELGVTGCPILSGALAWFDCELESTVATGDHLLAIGRVVATGTGPDSDDPLLNYEGAYRRIEGA
jgi:flavin reductase (DIM6/NTAB) family NADH-FMN oxidoreductase RutF